MSDLDEIVSLTVEVDSSGVEKEGFGLAMILSHNATWPEYIRYYDSDAAVLADWASDSPEAVHAAALFAQSPHPPQVSIGRASSSVTLKYAMSPIVVTANHIYAVDIAGQGVTPTSCSYKTGTSKSLKFADHTTNLNTIVEAVDNLTTPTIQVQAGAGAGAGTITDVANVVTITLKTAVSTVADLEALLATATSVRIRAHGTGTNVFTSPVDVFGPSALATATVTNDEITSNLVALFNAVPGKNYTATQQGAAGSQTIQLLGNAPGNWFSAAVLDALSLKNAITNTGDPTTDLAAVALHADPSFYMVDTLYNSASYVKATAAWTEANGCTYIFDVPETDVLNATSVGVGGDTVDSVTSHGYKRTLGQYHPSQAEALSASLDGRIIALNPGLWTAAFKTLSGPSPISITATQKANLKAKRGGGYFKRRGRSVTLYGQVGSTQYGFLDAIVGLDFFMDDIQTSAFGVFAGADKVAYDDADIEQIAAAIRGAIARSASDDHKIISRGTPGSLTDPLPSIVFPLVADIDPSQRALRNVPDGVLTCRLLGAAQSVAMRIVVTF